MSEDTDTTETEAPATEAPPPHMAETQPAPAEEKLTDAELSAKRGLSHRDGPTPKFVSARERIEEIRKQAAAAAKGGKAPVTKP